MSDSSDSPQQDASPPGRARTAWHPLLVRLLRWLLRDAYEVRDEVPVGAMPLRIDVLLIRREVGQVSPVASAYAPELIARLRRRTLIEFKSPADSLEAGDWEALMAYTLHYLQQDPLPLANEELSLVFLAPCLTRPFLERLALRGLQITAVADEKGVHQISGGLFDTWVIETDEMAGRNRPLLSVFSRRFLKQPRDIMQELTAAGYGRMLLYVAQQIKQFRQTDAEGISMLPDVGGPELEPEVISEFLQMLTAEQRLQGLTPADIVRVIPVQELLQGLAPEDRLEGLSPEDRLEGLSPEDRLEGLSTEDLLEGLSHEERMRLKKLLEAEAEGGGE